MDKVNVISLERSELRRANFQKTNTRLNFDFFNAVDGSRLTTDAIQNTGLFEPNLPYTKGAYGSALSHLALWDQALATNELVTVAEDDGIFRNDFQLRSRQLISSLRKDWDIVLWGWNFDSILSLDVMPGVSPAVMQFDQSMMRDNIDTFQAIDSEVAALKLDKCFGLVGYTISPQGAEKFKNLCCPLSNFETYFPLLNRNLPNNSLDLAMNRFYQSTETFVSFPPLVITKNEHSDSLIIKRD